MSKIEKIPRDEQPLFWMNEASGRMKQIVQDFFNKKLLKPTDLRILKNYIIQWVDNTVKSIRHLVSEKEFKDYLKNGVPPDYQKKIGELNQDQLMNYIVEELLKYGLDPF